MPTHPGMLHGSPRAQEWARRTQEWARQVLHETMHERLLPGEGAVPLVDLLRRVEEGASPAPYTLEIFSDAHNAHGPEEAVARAVASLERVCEAVSNRGGG